MKLRDIIETKQWPEHHPPLYRARAVITNEPPQISGMDDFRYRYTAQLQIFANVTCTPADYRREGHKHLQQILFDTLFGEAVSHLNSAKAAAFSGDREAAAKHINDAIDCMKPEV